MQWMIGHELPRPVIGLSVLREMNETAWQMRRRGLLALIALAATCKVYAQAAPATSDDASDPYTTARCLPDGSGYFRARLSGILETELDWGNQGTQCTGAVRPTDQGIRMQFIGRSREGERLSIVIGIARLREGARAKNLPANITLIREGAGEFYGTQGDDKCVLERVSQKALVGIPYKHRVYRVVVRGFCIEPARAVRGHGSILMSRFDYAGRVDFGLEPDDPAPTNSQK